MFNVLNRKRGGFPRHRAREASRIIDIGFELFCRPSRLNGAGSIKLALEGADLRSIQRVRMPSVPPIIPPLAVYRSAVVNRAA